MLSLTTIRKDAFIVVKRLSVTSETKTGRNTRFHDNLTGENLTRTALVKQIEQGSRKHYHIRVIGGVKTPVSNPDKSTNNNLGKQ